MNQINKPAKKTNILFIFCDQMRWDCIKAAGNKVIQTPNLDRLASQGVLFKNTYSTAPLCVPARAHILTGLPCWETGVWGLGDRVPPPMRTFAHALNEQGYFTGVAGKMHFKPTGGGGSIREPHGFQKMLLSEEVLPGDDLLEDDYWQYLNCNGFGHVGKYTHGKRSPDYFKMGYLAQVSELPNKHFDTTWTGDETIRMLKKNAKRPFFIWCSFVKPHFPCELPSDWPCPYRPEDIPLDKSYFDPNHENFSGETQGSVFKAGWLEEKTLRDFAAYYYGNITLVDIQIGRILDTLEELDLLENTLIIFSADHGEHLGGHCQIGKGTFYEESTKVPMIVSGSMVSAAGTIDERPVILEDLCPTFIDASGAQIPGNLIGESILPLLREPQKKGRDEVFGILGGDFHFDPKFVHCFVQSGKWKYMYQFEEGMQKLYNLAEDPHEMRDISDSPQYQDVCRKLNCRIAKWFNDNGASFLTRDGKLRKNLLDRKK